MYDVETNKRERRTAGKVVTTLFLNGVREFMPHEGTETKRKL